MSKVINRTKLFAKRTSNSSSGSGITSIVAGTNITVDNTDPANPIVSSTADDITVVANYSALPAVGTVTGKFYWCSASQGTAWLPGSLGGTLGAGFNTFHNLNITGTLNIVDNIIYESNLTIAGGSVISFLPPDGSFTFNEPASVIINSSAGNLVEFKSTTIGSQTGISGDGSSTYRFSYMKITDSNANNGTFIVTNSINGGDNSGWIFDSGANHKKILKKVLKFLKKKKLISISELPDVNVRSRRINKN